jgi:hypothetical protein
MNGFVADIQKLTEGSGDFRRVLYAAKHLQLVLMTLPPGEQIGEAGSAPQHFDGKTTQ